MSLPLFFSIWICFTFLFGIPLYFFCGFASPVEVISPVDSFVHGVFRARIQFINLLEFLAQAFPDSEVQMRSLVLFPFLKSLSLFLSLEEEVFTCPRKQVRKIPVAQVHPSLFFCTWCDPDFMFSQITWSIGVASWLVSDFPV